MRNLVFAIACVLSLAGCGSAGSTTIPTAESSSERSATPAEVANVPASLPFITVGNLGVQGNGAADRVVFDQQDDLDRYLAAHPGVLPSRFASTNPQTAPMSDSASTVVKDGKLDFGRYQLVLFQARTFDLTGNARVVSIVEEPARRVVHTARWIMPNLPPNPQDDISVAHVVAVPRSNKPLAFAPTMAVTIGQWGAPSPTTGRAARTFTEGPRWRAVPNPELTEERIEAAARRGLGAQPPARFILQRQTLAAAGWGSLGNLSTNSEVWVATAEGTFGLDAFPGSLTSAPTPLPSGVVERRVVGYSRLISIFSIEDGTLLGHSASPVYDE
jgi:predicted small lipoprotein YifL